MKSVIAVASQCDGIPECTSPYIEECQCQENPDFCDFMQSALVETAQGNAEKEIFFA